MDDNTLLQLEGYVESVVYRNEENGYTVVEISDDDDYITAVGIMPRVHQGDLLKLTGNYKEHPNYGRQFSAQVCELCRPSGTAGILRYLSSGAIRGIGATTAQRLVSEFGEKTLDVMENEPERVAMLKGISKSKAEDFSLQLKQSMGIRSLILFLGEYGIGNAAAVKIFTELGTSAIEQIKENPYILCNGEFGISFQTADFIAKKRDFDEQSTERLRAGIAYILIHNEGNGHTCLPFEVLCKKAADFLKVDIALIASTMQEMIFDRSLIKDNVNDKEFIFSPNTHLCELYIASRVKMLLGFVAEQIKNIDTEIEKCEKNDGIEYAALQKEAITQALTKGMLVLTGGPGTGKTTTLNAIIKILQNNGKKVLLAAPTGRAAQRMSALTGVEAKTIHRLLEVSWDKHDKPIFNKNERNQLKCDALIVDEVSMVDTFIFESVMKALPIGCRLILVGDSNQLPSVGPGNILGDLTDCGIVPVVRLNEIFRQAQKSLIVTNAHKIVNGEMPVLNASDKDFFFLLRNNKTGISQVIVDLCAQRLPKAYGYSAFDNIQVLCPSKKGELGTAEMNFRLQKALNPKSADKAEIEIASKTFRIGDKVMQIKNNYDITWIRDDGEQGSGIFNGDIGIIDSIDRKSRTLIVIFDDKTAKYTYEYATDLDFAYAVTVHKSQGNEFDCVIIPMFQGPPQLYYRNLLYTAVTRAKKTLVLVGNPKTVEYMVQNNRRTKRYSGLKEFLLRDEQLY